MHSDRRSFLSTLGYSLASGSLFPSLSACKSRRLAKVLVIGGGLAGLNCARLLQEQGLEPVVLEAGSKPGGRTRSINIDGLTINLGGIEIGNGYKRFIDLAKEHQLDTYSPASGSRELAIFQANQLINAREWASTSSNPLPDSLKSTLPSRLQFGLHMKDFKLSGTTDWLDQAYGKYDVAESQRLTELGADPATIALINRAGNFNHIDDISSLHILRSYAYFRFGTSTKTLRLSGGNDQLALAMADRQQHLYKNHRVTRIVETSAGIEVDCDNGSLWTAERVVIALPFSVLRGIDIKLQLPASHHQAIADLPYTNISKLVTRVEKPFWDIDGLPANMWCDSALERGFLSSAENGEKLYTVFINGVGAGKVDSMPDAQASNWIMQELAKTRPSTIDALKPLVYHSWGNDPLARGAYHAFAPGQINAFGRSMVNPTERVFFAGEHCARSEPGLEGALESGENTAQQILNS